MMQSFRMQTEEQQLALNDSKYRSYVSVMDKALRAFEYTNEWADLISALAKINKVVLAHKSFSHLPKKVTIGKRLAQCLHPALPAGVHIKALELYEVIFKNIGAASLARDFPIYSAGLLPLLSHAAMTVKPALLKIYENSVLPISSSIKPAAAGIILGVLPGLEEGSEFHERTNTLLENFSESFGVEHFYSNLWSCLFSSPAARLAGTSYLLAHVDKSRSMEDQLYLLGNDLGLLVSALKCCLEDTAVLVQRNTLDILCIAFPFHDSQLTRSDQSRVIESALLVLLRRDMSLNRRLYGWLLGVTTAGTRVVNKNKADTESSSRQRHDSGSSSASEPELEYFNVHSRRLLVQSLRSHLDHIVEASFNMIKSLRVIISLLDKVEIGSVVLEDILVNIFKFLRRFYSLHTEKQLVGNSEMCTYSLAQSLHLDPCSTMTLPASTGPLSAKLHSELLKTCNLLFATLEPHFLWEFLADTYEKVLWPSEVRQDTCISMSEYCDIVSMLLSIVSLESYVEIQTAHIPRLLYNLLNMLKENITNTSLSDMTQVLVLCRRLVNVIAPSDVSSTEDNGVETITVHDCVCNIQDILYTSILAVGADQESEDDTRSCALLSCCLLLIEISSFPIYSTNSDLASIPAENSDSETSQNLPEWIQSLISAATGETRCGIQCEFISAAVLLDLIKLCDLSLETEYRPRHLNRSSSLDGATSIDEQVTIQIRPVIEQVLSGAIRTRLQDVFAYIWSHVDADGLLYSKETSLLLHNLLYVTSNTKSLHDTPRNAMQTIIIKDLTQSDVEQRLQSYKNFALFWHQTRDLQSGAVYTHHILMVVLSSLLREAEIIQEVIRDWIIHSVQCDDINRIIEPLLILLLESDTSKTSVQQKNKPAAEEASTKEDTFQKSLAAAQSQIKSISSDGQVQMRADDSKYKYIKPGTQSLVSKEGNVTPSHLINEPLDCENATRYSIAGLALNPFGTTSDLDHLIFDGFTPHESLKNRWSAVVDNKKEDYKSVISRAKRLDKDTCEREGIVFGDGQAVSQPSQPSHNEGSDEPKAKSKEAPSTNAIPMPDNHVVHSVKEEPPPLGDEDTFEMAEGLVDDIVTKVVAKIDDDVHISSTANVSANANTNDAGSVSMSQQELGQRRHSILSSITSTGSVSSRDSMLNEPQSEMAADDSPTDTTAGTHGFVLIYDQCYDTERVHFALSVIQKMIGVNPSLILSSLTASTCSDSRVLNLLARQKKSIGGDNYYTDLSQEEIVSLRNIRLLEILVMLCLYFWRSYHSLHHSTADGCVSQNSQVQLKSIEVLRKVTCDLSLILADSPKGFPHYLVDVLHKCKVVKTCIFHLQCLLGDRVEKLEALGVTHDKSVDPALFSKCLQLTESLILLESKLQLVHDSQSAAIKGLAPPLFKRMLFSHPSLLSSMILHLSEARYAAVHHQWLSVVTNSLPHVFTQPVTAELLQSVIIKVCQIFDRISSEADHTADRKEYPPDYIQQLLEDFTVICHFCFIDVSSSSIGQSGLEDAKPSGISTGQILSNLVSVFNPLNKNRMALGSEQGAADRADLDPRVRCRDSLLSMLPKILASVSNLWRVHQLTEDVKVVQLVVEFFSPILHNYAEELLGSVAVVWSDSHDVTTSALRTQTTLVDLLISIKALPMDTIVDKLSLVMKKPPNTDHQTNARLDLIFNNCIGERDQVILQLSCLKFLKGYISKTTTIAKNSLSSVCSLLKHCLQLGLPAPGILLLLETVTVFVYKLGIVEDRKTVKDLQEIVGKVLEACCQIISSQLEASSWTIRKNYTVKVKAPSAETSNDLYNMSTDAMTNSTPGISVEDHLSTEEHESEYTAHALSLLAEVTAGLLDVVYPSEDKDKVAPLLTNILTRVFPYLRNHSLLNMSSFQSSSKLLASISSYQYTRRTWRRDVYDILLSIDFFKMDVQSLQFWKILTDNLVTHEKAMLKDLLAKFMIAGNATIQLFTSKDSESHQRAHNLKKLSFLIYCGDVDYYKHYMPEIQERLAENLKLTQAPTVLSQVFLCFRVLLLRMSPNALTSLWPTIITELVNVMTHIEEDLTLSEEEEQQISRVSELDSFSNLSEANVQQSMCWQQLYLSACKLLDLITFLPCHLVPDFQHYVWMFCGTDDSSSAHNLPTINGMQQTAGVNGVLPTGFSAHIPRVSQLMTLKFGEYRSPSNQSTVLLLQQQTISSIRDLQPFFARLLKNPTRASSCDHLKEAQAVLDNDLTEPVS